MKFKSIIFLSAIVVAILAVLPITAVAKPLEKIIEHKDSFFAVIPDTNYQVEGWISVTNTVVETPKGIRRHMFYVIQAKVYDSVAEEYVGHVVHAAMGAVLEETPGEPPEDSMVEHNMVLNIKGPDMQGIEGRMKVVSIMQNGDLKVNIDFNWMNL